MRNLHITIFLLLLGCVVCLSCQEMYDTNYAQEIDGFQKMLDNIYGFQTDYPKTYTMKDTQVVLFFDESESVLLWNHDGKGNSRIGQKDEIDQGKTFSDFSDGTLNGRDTVYIRYQGDLESSFTLAVHEGYHFYGQAWLGTIDISEYRPRGSFYPEDETYGHLLRESFLRLYDKIDGKNNDGDAEALYFHNVLKQETPDTLELDLETNLAEGTANFIEAIFLAAATQPELQSNYPELCRLAFQLNFKHYTRADIYQKGFEYYKISSLPYFYLGMEGKGEYLPKISEDKYPYELLKYITEPKTASFDETTKTEVLAYFNGQNRKNKTIIDGMIEKSNSPEHIKIQIPEDLFEGSVQYGGFITFRNGAEYNTINIETTVSSPSIDLKSIDTLTIYIDFNPHYEVYIPKQSVTIENGQLRVTRENIVIKGIAFTKIDGGYRVDKPNQ